MMNKLKELLIDGAKYNYYPDTEYIKDGHAYCKVCNERKDGEVMDIFGSKKIFKRQCECDRNRLKKEAERKKQQEIEDLKKRCFNSMNQWAYTFDNYQGGKEQCFTVAKNFVKEYETMKKENIGLLFFGTVGSGKTYLACAIANALIEEYLIRVKIRNFAQIINDLQKGGFDFDKNEYIESIVSVPVLILDDLGIERDTSYAKEQVYNIVNSRYLKNKPTIFTTNIPIEQIKNSDDGVEYERIYSRIMEMCIPIKVTGEDFRKKVQKRKLERNRERLLGGGER
ncbi:MAG: ATP-binding protein [Peptostreptococcaceae bacterium]|nr:ATP-binding protein [Peptostreptococcaceae bacterium]